MLAYDLAPSWHPESWPHSQSPPYTSPLGGRFLGRGGPYFSLQRESDTGPPVPALENRWPGAYPLRWSLFAALVHPWHNTSPHRRRGFDQWLEHAGPIQAARFQGGDREDDPRSSYRMGFPAHLGSEPPSHSLPPW